MLSQAIKWPVSSYNHTCNYTGKWYYLHQLYIHQMFLWCFAASTVHSEITRCSLWRLCFHCLHRLNMLWAAVTMQLILVLLLVKPLIFPVFDWSALVISLFIFFFCGQTLTKTVKKPVKKKTTTNNAETPPWVLQPTHALASTRSTHSLQSVPPVWCPHKRTYTLYIHTFISNTVLLKLQALVYVSFSLKRI